MKIKLENYSKIILLLFIAMSFIAVILTSLYIYTKVNYEQKLKAYEQKLKAYEQKSPELEKSLSRSSKIIENQANIIDYLKNNPLKVIVENNCVNQNFHLKNSDFGYSDLHTKKTFTINKKFTYNKNLYLQDIKFLDINHSGVSKIEIIKDEFILKLTKETDSPRAIDLIGIFKKDNSLACQIPIRVFFFGEKIISQKNELLKLYKNVSVIGKIGDQAGKFNLPYGSTFYNGRLFVTDCINNKVQVFNKQGRRLVTFGQKGNKTGHLGGVSDIQVRNDKIYITEQRNHRISVFGFDGKFIESFGSYARSRENPNENNFETTNATMQIKKTARWRVMRAAHWIYTYIYIYIYI